MSKLSPRLQEVLESFALSTWVPLNVSIKRDISHQARDRSIDQVRQLCTSQEDLEFIPISGTLHCELPLSKIAELAKMPLVEWVDLEKQRPLEELLD